MDVFLLGGQLHKPSLSVKGIAAAEAASGITAGLVVPGIHPAEGLTTADPEDAALKRILMRRAAETYIVASIEKLGAVATMEPASSRPHNKNKKQVNILM